MSLRKLPLHIQILIALIVGTVIGTLVNPGEVELGGSSTLTITGDTQSGPISLIEQRDDGEILFESEFSDYETFAKRFPSLAEDTANLTTAAPVELEAERRRAHIIEDGSSIKISYTRRFRQEVVITRYETASSEQLAEDLPAWQQVYTEHGGGTGRTIAIVAKWIGDLFLRLLKMITVPLILTSLITGVSGLGNTSRFGAMFGRTLLYYLATSLLAITIGLTVVNIIQPGKGASLPGGGKEVAGGDESLTSVFGGLVDKMIPTNPLNALANGDFLSIICFSILFGIFIIYTGGEHGKRLAGLFEAAFEVMMRMTMAIIRLAPIGVLAFMLYATATQGLEIFQTLAKYMLAVFVALLIHATVVLPLIIKFVARRSPLEFARAMSPALMTAFSTASSNATLPLTITSVEQRAGVSNRVSSFVLPLGATINMDGTALYEAVAVLFIAQATPGFELTLGSQVAIAITALLASVGAAGIPHAGLVMMAIVLQAVGLPLEAQGIIIAVDRVLDMCRTSVNVWSDSCGCAVIDRFEPAESTG